MFLPLAQRKLIINELEQFGITTGWEDSWSESYNKENTAAYSDIYNAAVKTNDFIPKSDKDLDVCADKTKKRKEHGDISGVWYEVMVKGVRGNCKVNDVTEKYIARNAANRLIKVIECAMRDKNIDDETIFKFITRILFFSAYWFDANKQNEDDESNKKPSMLKTKAMRTIYLNKSLFLALAQNKWIFTALHFYATFENYKYLRCIEKYLDELINNRFYKYKQEKDLSFPKYIPYEKNKAYPPVGEIRIEILEAISDNKIETGNFLITAFGFNDIAPKHFGLLETFARISTSEDALREMYCVFREIDKAAGGVSAHKIMNKNIYANNYYETAFNNALFSMDSKKTDILRRILEYHDLKPASALPDSYTALTLEDYDIKDLAHEYFESLCEDDEDYDETGEFYEDWDNEEFCLIKIPAEKVPKKTADKIKKSNNEHIKITDSYYELPVLLYIPLFLNKTLNAAVYLKSEKFAKKQ